MKLLLGLFLISAVLYSVHMLQCLTCDTLYCEKQSLTNCFSNYSCATIQTRQMHPGLNYTVLQKLCLQTDICAYYDANGTTFTSSFGIGRTSYTLTVSCCNTNGCNNASIDAPNKTPNGLKCKSCGGIFDYNCENFDMDCMGSQDRCFSDKASSLPFGFGYGKNHTLRGCISRNFCKPSKIWDVNCLEGTFINNRVSWMSEVNFSLLLLSLITFVLLF
nr:phospholipase A2 inhibitor gamma subunit B-like [Misgurnus anguillicaudatus]